MEKIKSFKDLLVWQKAINLSVEVYNITKKFPRNELFGLTSQIRRASNSIALNIAEGYGRNTKKSFILYLRHSLGSLNEVESSLYLAVAQSFIIESDAEVAFAKIMEEGKMLNSLISSLSKSN